jgi:hypothetical protein
MFTQQFVLLARQSIDMTPRNVAVEVKGRTAHAFPHVLNPGTRHR